MPNSFDMIYTIVILIRYINKLHYIVRYINKLQYLMVLSFTLITCFVYSKHYFYYRINVL